MGELIEAIGEVLIALASCTTRKEGLYLLFVIIFVVLVAWGVVTWVK